MKKYYENERVIYAFLNNYKMTDVIRESGLSKSTAYKLRNDEVFQRILRGRKEAILQNIVNKMTLTIVGDTQVLQSIIDDADTSPQIRLNAIALKWCHLREWTTICDVLRRLDVLEHPDSYENSTFRG